MIPILNPYASNSYINNLSAYGTSKRQNSLRGLLNTIRSSPRVSSPSSFLALTRLKSSVKKSEYNPFSGLQALMVPLFVPIQMELLSDRSIRLSFKKDATPCEISASLSISPIRKPPPAPRPPTGYRVMADLGPVVRTFTLSAT